MSYNKTMWGNTYSVPEAGNNGVGPAGTAILDDVMDGVDGLSFQTGGAIVIPYLLATSTSLSAGATLTPTHPVHVVQGTASPVTLSGTTAIANGTKDGQFLELQGANNGNVVTIQDGANVQLALGDVRLQAHDTLTLRWDASAGDWIEQSRSGSHRLQNQASLEFYENPANGVNKISLKAPSALTADLVYTLPGTIVANGFLQCAADGTLTWGSPAGVTMDAAYDGGSAVTVDTGAVTFNVTAAINGLRIAKTNAGAGSPLSIDNDGTGSAVDIRQDGAGIALDADIPLGGNVARFRATTSGDPYITVRSAFPREFRAGCVDAGNVYVGSSTNHPFEIRTNDVARITVANGVAEVAIGGATVAGVGLTVYGSTISEARIVGSSGEGAKLIVATGTLSGFTGATMTATAAIPAGAQVQMVTFRIQTTITGPATMDCGVSGALTRYINAKSTFTAGTQYRSTIDGAQTTPNSYSANTDLVFTATGGNFTAGAVKYSISYFAPQAPTS